LRVHSLLARVFGNGEETGENADDVAVENGRGLVEGNAGNGAGRVAAHPGQFKNGGPVRGKLAAVNTEDVLRGFLKVPDARVVAQAFPEFQQSLFGRGGERGDLGQLAHPAFPIRDDGLHLGLLQHDLADPDRIRIQRAPPREVAGSGGEPIEQRGNERTRNTEREMRSGSAARLVAGQRYRLPSLPV